MDFEQEYTPLTTMEDAKTGVVSTMVGGVGAAVADFIGSTYNSLVPESMEVDTRDLVARVGDNALKVYDENPDAVHLASFIGGVFIPAGLTLKATSALRGGMKGANWFSEAGKVDQLGKINTLIQDGQKASKAYNDATRALYMRNFANTAIVDNAAAELAIYATMNAHPLMEDYVKDPVANFGVSMMLGAAIVGPLAHIGERFAVRNLGMKAEGEAVNLLLKDSVAVAPTEDLSMQIAQHQINIDNWTNFQNLAGQTQEYNKLTTNLADSFVQTAKARQVEAFNAMVSDDIKNLPKELGGDEIRNELMAAIANNPELWSGINTVQFASAKEEINLLQQKFGKLFSSTAEPTKGIPLTKYNKDGDLKLDTMVYSPTFKSFMRRDDLANYGVAADLVSDPRKLTKGMGKAWYLQPDYEATWAKDVSSSAALDLDYLRKLKAVDELPEEELSKFAISPDDGPTLNAFVARVRKMVNEGKDVSNLKVILTSETPNWGKIEEQFVAREIARNQAKGVAGISPDYIGNLQKEVQDNFEKYNLLAPGASTNQTAQTLLSGWRGGGGMGKMRQAMDDAFRPSKWYAATTTPEVQQAVRNMYNSPESTALRKTLMRLADSEGYVWLYRGMTGKAFSSSTLESFTTNIAKAKDFDKPQLYKVRVEDVFGGIRDIGGYHANKKELSTEILVLSHTRDALDPTAIHTATVARSTPPELTKLANYGIDSANFGGKYKASVKNLINNSYDDFMSNLDKTKYMKQGVEKYVDEVGKGMHTGLTPEEAQVIIDKYVEEATKVDAGRYINTEVQEYVNELNAFNVMKAANSTKSVNEADLAMLQDRLMQIKSEDIKTLAGMGYPPETIGLRTNTPVDSVKRVLLGEKLEDQRSVVSYGDASIVEQYITPAKRSLAVSTTWEKIPAAQIRSGIQNTMMDEVDREVKRQMMLSSQSATMQDLAAFVYSADNQARYKMLLDGMGQITDSANRSKFFTSTNFTLRDMGQAGEIITAVGKDSQHLYDAAAKKLLTKLSADFTPIVLDAAGTVEFNTAREINAALKGERYYSDGKFWVQGTGKDGKPALVAVQYQGRDFEITTPAVKQAYDEMNSIGRELYAMNSTFRKTIGMPPLSDIGFWMPAFNPRNKYITYVIDKVDGSTKLLYGNTPAELADAERAFASTMADRSPKSWKLVRKGQDQQLYNITENRHDPMFMSVSDATSLHGGSSAMASVPTGTNIFSELMNGYEHYIHKAVGQQLELQYSEIMQHIDRISNNAQSLTKGQPVSRIQQAMNVANDAGLTVKNTLLGRNNLKEYVGWQDAQNGLTTVIEMGLKQIADKMEPILNPAKSVFGRGKAKTDAEYEALIQDMADRGIPNPFQTMDDAVARQKFNTDKLTQATGMTARTVAISNNFAATALLKVLELGQPIVNMLSLPILTSAAVNRQFAQEYMGAALKGNGQFSTIAAMHEGAKFLFNPEYVNKWRKMGLDLGITKPVLSEVSEFMQMSRSFNPGLMQKAENLMNSRMVDMLSKPAIWSEQAVREMSFATGIRLAKKAYPDLGDAGVMTFARNFVDTAVGNYSPAQRPTLFQGTIGSAMGLFQTYMVTLAQEIYRGFELKNYKALAKMMLTQASIFGGKSLPGFNEVSNVIGEHFSEDHYDFTTGTYKALPSGVADVILYGMPSSLGPAVYTRGDIQPRVPNLLGGVQNLAAVQIAKQTLEAGKALAGAAGDVGEDGAAINLLEALSLQSVSRPIARFSELISGHSVTKSGNQIADQQEVWSTQGIMARILATRGIREVKAREAQFQNSMYNAIDVEERKAAAHKLKTHIRSGTLTPDIMEKVQEQYMRTGSASGWRSAVNKALIDTDSPGVSAVRNHLHPSAVANRMIDDIE